MIIKKFLYYAMRNLIKTYIGSYEKYKQWYKLPRTKMPESYFKDDRIPISILSWGRWINDWVNYWKWQNITVLHVGWHTICLWIGQTKT